MKKIAFVLLVGLWGAGLGALNDSRVAFWENDLKVHMGLNDLMDLDREQKDLVTKLKANPSDQILKTRLGIIYHNLSRVHGENGEKGNAARAEVLLKSVVQDPKVEEELKVIAMAYWGSSIVLKGAEESNPGLKITLVDQGMGILDQAVGKYGNLSYLPRFIRGNVGIALPDFFEKINTAGEDFKALETYIKSHGDRVPQEIQSSTYYLLGNYFKIQRKLKVAIGYWEKALQLDQAKRGSGRLAAEALDIYAD